MTVPLTRPYVRRKEWDKVLDCMMQDRWQSGEKASALADELGRYWGCCRAWSFAGSADAIRYLFRSLHFAPGDGVILSPLAPSPWLGILLEFGVRPLFVDVLIDSPVLDPNAMKNRLQENPRAIILDTSLGYMPDWEAFRNLGIFLIEDVSQGLGGFRDLSLAGTVGDVVFASLGTESLITAGRGSVLGVRQKRHLDDFFLGEPMLDDRMPEPNAVMALSLWSERENLIEKKKENFRRLFHRLSRTHRQPKQYGVAEIVPPWFPLLPSQGGKDILLYAQKKGVECGWAFPTKASAKVDIDLDFCPNARYLLLHTLLFPLPAILSSKEEEVLGKVLSTLP